MINLDSAKLFNTTKAREISVTLDNILDNSKASSGGHRDVNFLKYLIDNRLLNVSEVTLKRTKESFDEEFFKETYKKMSYESDRHYLCRASIQEELKKLGIKTSVGLDVGNMGILRANCSYDIVSSDFSLIIDIGLTPARSYFRGLTDLRVQHYLLSPYFDDYMDEIIFANFSRISRNAFLEAMKDYQEGFKDYTPNIASFDAIRSDSLSKYVE